MGNIQLDMSLSFFGVSGKHDTVRVERLNGVLLRQVTHDSTETKQTMKHFSFGAAIGD